MVSTEAAAEIAAGIRAKAGHQAAVDYLVDRLIDTDDEREAAALSALIDAVEAMASRSLH